MTSRTTLSIRAKQAKLAASWCVLGAAYLGCVTTHMPASEFISRQNLEVDT